MRGLMDRSEKSLQLIETCPKDRPFAVQLFGSDPIIMRDAAQFLEVAASIPLISIWVAPFIASPRVEPAQA